MLRINLKRGWRSGSVGSVGTRQNILNHLIKLFCDDYDISKEMITQYIGVDDAQLSIFVKYLTEVGYKVRIYRLEGAKKDTLSWGLEFDDDCELITFLKLKYLEEEK